MNKKENDPRTHAIIGSAMEVHREMGPGFLEAVYHECLEMEFGLKNIPYISKPQLSLYYKQNKLKKYYIPDFLIFEEVILEIKAEKSLCKEDQAQIISSLKSSKKKVGLLINFGELSLVFKRFVY
jgi:GxxExxY protein